MRARTQEEFRLVYKKLVDTNNRRAEKNGTTFKVIVIVYHTVSNASNKNNLLFVIKNLKNVAQDSFQRSNTISKFFKPNSSLET